MLNFGLGAHNTKLLSFPIFLPPLTQNIIKRSHWSTVYCTVLSSNIFDLSLDFYNLIKHLQEIADAAGDEILLVLDSGDITQVLFNFIFICMI
jgi:hypothetical protein